MDPTPEQRKAFGERLRALRREAGLSARELATALGSRKDGTTWSHASITGWERGEFAPRQVDVVMRLEELLTARPGSLLQDLGVHPDRARLIWQHPSVDRQFQDLLRRLASEDATGVLRYLLDRVAVVESQVHELRREMGLIVHADDFAFAAEGDPDREQQVGTKVNRPSPEPEPEGP